MLLLNCVCTASCERCYSWFGDLKLICLKAAKIQIQLCVQKVLYVFWSWHWGEPFWLNVGVILNILVVGFHVQNLCSSHIIYREYVSVLYITLVVHLGMTVEAVRTEVNHPVSLNCRSTTWILSTFVSYCMLCLNVEISVALTSLTRCIIVSIIQ